MTSSLYSQHNLKLSGSRGDIRHSKVLPNYCRRRASHLKYDCQDSMQQFSVRLNRQPTCNSNLSESNISTSENGERPTCGFIVNLNTKSSFPESSLSIPGTSFLSTKETSIIDLHCVAQPGIDESCHLQFTNTYKPELSPTVPVVKERYHESLQRNYRLLVTHINLNNDIIQLMAKEKILPETMIKDIQSAKTQEEQNHRLLSSIRLRGNGSFKRFRDLMYRTGNFFVADLLFDDNSLEIVNENDLDDFPELTHGMDIHQKQKLTRFLNSKVKEKMLLQAWNDFPSERLESLNSKLLDFDHQKGYRDKISSREQQMKALEDELNSEKDVSHRLKMNKESLQQQLTQLKLEHRSSLDTQTRLHDANLSTIIRLKEKLSKCNSNISNLTKLVQEQVKDELMIGSDGEDEQETRHILALRKSVCCLITQLKHEKGENRKHCDQREQVLKLLNRMYSKEPLVNIIKDFLKHDLKHRVVVMKEVRRVAEVMKRTVSGNSAINTSASEPIIDSAALETKHFKSQLDIMKADAEHIKKRFSWKESELSTLRHQLAQARFQLSDMQMSQKQNMGEPDSTFAVKSPGSKVCIPTDRHDLLPHPTSVMPEDSDAPSVEVSLYHPVVPSSYQTPFRSPACYPALQETTLLRSQEDQALEENAGDSDKAVINAQTEISETCKLSESRPKTRCSTHQGLNAESTTAARETKVFVSPFTDFDKTLVNYEQYFEDENVGFDDNERMYEGGRGDSDKRPNLGDGFSGQRC